VDLAVAGRGGERHGIEVIDDNLFAPGARIGARAIRLETRADDLAQFFERRIGPAVRRVAKFFQLNRESTPALHRHRQVQFGADVEHYRLERAVPLDHRVLPGRCRVIEVAVLQKQQGLDQQWRDGFGFGEQKLRLAVAKQR
jgi:hypothetical protein